MKKSEMQGMMRGMMEDMCAGMTADDKKEMMMGMMSKMQEGVDTKGMAPEMVQRKMGSGGVGDGGGCGCDMSGMMEKLQRDGETQETAVPEMMLRAMMPHCIKSMMPSVSKSKRVDIASAIAGAAVEAASGGMSDEEKDALRVAVVAKVVEGVGGAGA